MTRKKKQPDDEEEPFKARAKKNVDRPMKFGWCLPGIATDRCPGTITPSMGVQKGQEVRCGCSCHTPEGDKHDDNDVPEVSAPDPKRRAGRRVSRRTEPVGQQDGGVQRVRKRRSDGKRRAAAKRVAGEG